jgi:hypothetical protein
MSSQTLGFSAPSAETVTRDSFPAFVASEILRTSGPQPPCQSAGDVLTAFWDRLGPDKAMEVCARAFGPMRGIWRSAPVTPRRFAEDQDWFFALPLLAGEVT